MANLELLETQNGNSKWKFKMETQNGNSKWKLKMETQNGNSKWKLKDFLKYLNFDFD